MAAGLPATPVAGSIEVYSENCPPTPMFDLTLTGDYGRLRNAFGLRLY